MPTTSISTDEGTHTYPLQSHENLQVATVSKPQPNKQKHSPTQILKQSQPQQQTQTPIHPQLEPSPHLPTHQLEPIPLQTPQLETTLQLHAHCSPYTPPSQQLSAPPYATFHTYSPLHQLLTSQQHSFTLNQHTHEFEFLRQQQASQYQQLSQEIAFTRQQQSREFEFTRQQQAVANLELSLAFSELRAQNRQGFARH